MASRKALLIAATSMAVVMGALLPTTAWPDIHNNYVVGEMDGWRLGVNYDNWARVNTGIPAGSTLQFIYNPAFHNVVVVADEDSYNRCIVPNNNVQTFNSGDDELEMPNVGKFFFFCSMADHCTRGMKFAITVIPSE